MDNKKILNELKNLLTNNLSLKIKKVILFGSQIITDIRQDSDYDILIILEDDYDWRLEENIYDTSYELMLKYDVVFDIKIISVKELDLLRGKQPFIQSALRSGVYV